MNSSLFFSKYVWANQSNHFNAENFIIFKFQPPKKLMRKLNASNEDVYIYPLKAIFLIVSFNFEALFVSSKHIIFL